MDLAYLNDRLRDTPFADKLHHFPTINSTNTYALQQAAAAPTWSVYLADEQTAGRGRGSHAWHSEPASGLYVSILLRPKLSAVESLWISLAAGLAAHDSVIEVTGAVPDLRWPNDLMLGGKKFGGILTETQTDGDRLRHAVLGIGINVNHQALPAEIAPLATSLRLATGKLHSREEIFLALLRSLHLELQLLDSGTPMGTNILDRLAVASTWISGKQVRITDHDDLAKGYVGTTAGLDPRGFLLVNTATGRRTVLSGSVREA